MAVTIEDIAKEAGVSIATVSRVINKTKPVSTELRDRVYAVIEKNHFKPNRLAQGLITKKTNTIGIIVPDISNAVFGKLTKGINSVFAEQGYTVVLCESQGDPEKERKLLEILEEKQIEGLLFAGINVNHTLVECMQRRKYPTVLVAQETSESEEALHTVIHDNMTAMYDAVKFFLDNGHWQIAYLGGPANDFSSGRKRVSGYEKALREAGIEIKESYIVQGDFSFEAGYQGMKKIHEENGRLPTAVVAGSDVLAVGAIRYLENLGVRVPDDVSVMGFDDLEFAAYIRPELSTVKISYYDEGVRAAEMLKQLMVDDPDAPMKEYVPHRIIHRKTSKSLNKYRII